MIYNAIVGQSGGPTSAINSSLAGVIDALIKSDKIGTVFGAVNGIEGILEERIIELGEIFSSKENINLLKLTPSSYLGSCRHKLPENDDAVYEKIFDVFEKNNIKYFFYIGGNDSMDTVMKLNSYSAQHGKNLVVMGVPKTIDNDLWGTDHCPGFGSAAKYVAASVSEIALDSYCYNTNSVTIIEIMGRNAGWLTAASALARSEVSDAPHLIYCPENAFDADDFINDIKRLHKTVKNIIVAISEGIRDKNGSYIAHCKAHGDKFGHAQLGGAGKALEGIVKEKVGCKCRSIEINVLQRCAAHFSSKTDIEESFKIGKFAVKFALRGISGEMMIYKRKDTDDYKTEISSMNINEIANKEKMLPKSFITKNDVTDEFIKYARPLIMGENKTPVKNGIPVHITRTSLLKGTNY